MDKPDPTLAVSFAGLSLTSPIIAASAPPTESAVAMIACAAAGAGAIVTKSIVDYTRHDWPDIPRRVKRDRRGLWIQGSFQSETLTLGEGSQMIDAARQVIDVPIIASVGVLNPASDATIDTAMRLVEAGASMVHFDLFYLPQPRSSDEMLSTLAKLFRSAGNALPVPFGPKLNIDLPSHRFAQAISPDLIDALFLLDSIRVPPPILGTGAPAINAWHGGLECSLFGEWQKPISHQYTRVLADSGMPDICAGGGLRNAEDILEALMLGATTTQVATQIIIHGYDWIRRTNDSLSALLQNNGYTSVSATKGVALRVRDQERPENVSPMRARVDPARCQPCGVCTTLAFCNFIAAQPNGIPVIDDACYGCGLCETYCPHTGAIKMETTA